MPIDTDPVNVQDLGKGKFLSVIPRRLMFVKIQKKRKERKRKRKRKDM